MLFDLSLSLQEKVFPVSFYRSDTPWEQLIAMLNQTLNFKRLIFLERVEGNHRLKEIKAFNCKIEDIHEQRRDYERTPYSTAINENRAILLTNNYFKDPQTNEHEYLAPLIFAGEVLGFWAFSIDASKPLTNAKFSLLIEAYVGQISEILHYHQEWKKHLKMEQNRFLSYLRIEGGDAPYQMINRSVTLMDRRVSELQEVFNSVIGSCILYDLFGRVLLVNKGMEELGQAVSIRPYNLNMLDFVVKITQFDTQKAQHLLQQTIFDRKSISLPVTFSTSDATYMLNIKPLHSNKKQGLESFADETQVFQMLGILCELIDVTEMKKMAALREQMFEHFNFQMRNDMASILFALTFLKDQDVSEADKKLALDNIQGKLDENLQTLEMVSEQMNKQTHQLFDNMLECYPIDAKFSLQQVLNKYKASMQAKNIDFHLQLPQLISLVFASPGELENVLSILLFEMIEDTYQSGELWLEVEEKQGEIHFRLRNTGIGMPDDKMQQCIDLENIETQTSEVLEEMLDLHRAIYCVNQWGGNLKLSSQIGEGSKAELSLRCFM